MAVTSVIYIMSLFLMDDVAHVTKAQHWGYEAHNGPSRWPSMFPTCGGSEQSPIDIRTKFVERDPNVGRLHFRNYLIPLYSSRLINNGHSAQVEPTNVQNSYVEYRGTTYELRQLHFHWGSTLTKGSEHEINGKNYPMEMHLVHYNTNYGSYEEAIKYRDGLLVVAVFFQPSSRTNEALEPITGALKRVRNNGTETTINEGIVLQQLLPDSDCFFEYRGSLTTPTCDEIVQWIVFETPENVGLNQVKEFRTLLVGRKPLVNNFRPPQPLNNRKVLYSC